MKFTVRRVLILAPLLISLFLLQSYFWVPTYEDETKGNPGRLNEFITASIGDAAILNPVLSSDSASSDIEGLVFEGLLDYDQNLHLRGRLATSWEIFEEAYFYINPTAEIPGLKKASDGEVLRYLERAKARDFAVDPELRASLDNVTEITLLSPKEYVVTRSVKGKETETIKIHVQAPARIKFTLKKVDPDLFENLSRLLGEKYFLSFPSADYLSLAEGEQEKLKPAGSKDDLGLSTYAKDILPATEHNPIIVFHLRPDVKFHDGYVFSARDVKFTYEAIMNPENLSARLSDYEPVKAVEIIDPLTVRIFYKYLYSPAIGTWTIGILPAHLLDQAALRNEAKRRGMNPAKFTMRESRFNRHPIGCGPFVFKDWKSDQYILLDRFKSYWEGEPNYHRYYYRIVPDPLTQEMEFYSGTLDTYNVQPHQVKRLEEDPEYQHFSGLSFGYTYIGYNMRRHPFDDRRVRLALGMAIDVDKIIRYVLYGQGERITGPFPEQTDYYDRNIKPVPYDPEGALRLLKEAGWTRNSEGWLEKNGKRLQFTLITNSGNDIRKSIMAIVQNEWRQIGVDVRTDLLEWSVFIQERVNKLDFDALILGWQMGIEPDLYQIWYSTQTHPYQLNFVGFENPQADELIIKIRQEYNHVRQVAYCHELHEIIAHEQPYTFLYVGRWTAILDKRIVIKEVEASGKVIYKKITPTKTGNYTFYFNKWIKLPEVPSFSPEG
jgi:ABC-type transport system substrate-binding protein